jgi:hypothetical protein
VDSVADVGRALRALGNTNVVLASDHLMLVESRDQLLKDFNAEGIRVAEFWIPRNSGMPWYVIFPGRTNSATAL